MKFTDRFVKIPVKVFDQQQKELIGSTSYEDSWMKINPFEISNYKPTNDPDTGYDDDVLTYVSMKNGDGFLVFMTVDDFESLLNNHAN